MARSLLASENGFQLPNFFAIPGVRAIAFDGIELQQLIDKQFNSEITIGSFESEIENGIGIMRTT